MINAGAGAYGLLMRTLVGRGGCGGGGGGAGRAGNTPPERIAPITSAKRLPGLRAADDHLPRHQKTRQAPESPRIAPRGRRAHREPTRPPAGPATEPERPRPWCAASRGHRRSWTKPTPGAPHAGHIRWSHAVGGSEKRPGQPTSVCEKGWRNRPPLPATARSRTPRRPRRRRPAGGTVRWPSGAARGRAHLRCGGRPRWPKTNPRGCQTKSGPARNYGRAPVPAENPNQRTTDSDECHRLLQC